MEQVEVFEAHRFVRPLFGVAETPVGIAEARAIVTRVRRACDRDETYCDAGVFELVFDLAQLRERFTEEGSTDVPQPYDQRRERYPKSQNLRRRPHGELKLCSWVIPASAIALRSE